MIKKYPTIISFYTNTWEYPKYAKEMEKACDGLGLNHHIVLKEDSGEWITNTRIKPQFILETLQELKAPVLWIDVDGSILNKPELLKNNVDCDFAARRMGEHRARDWHVGTLFFNYTKYSLELLEKWSQKSIDNGGTDELNLDLLIKEDESLVKNLKIKELPKEYFEMLRQLNQKPSKKTVICHRASKGESKMKMKERLREQEKKQAKENKKLQND